MESSGVRKKHLNPASVNQIQILTMMAAGTSPKGESRKYQLHEIAELSGLKDEKETQRYLFILEGQKLVSPYPSGDFTSRVWFITPQGLETLKHISDSIAA